MCALWGARVKERKENREGHGIEGGRKEKFGGKALRRRKGEGRRLPGVLISPSLQLLSLSFSFITQASVGQFPICSKIPDPRGSIHFQFSTHGADCCNLQFMGHNAHSMNWCSGDFVTCSTEC